MKPLNSLSAIAVFCLSYAVLSYSALAQNPPSETQIVRADANACELNNLYIDYFAQDARSSGERVFVIARLGRGETSRTINRDHLGYARFMLTNKDVRPERLVIAEGERVAGEGRVEFYLGSRLYLVSLAKRNEMVCLMCCNDRPEGRNRVRRNNRRR